MRLRGVRMVLAAALTASTLVRTAAATEPGEAEALFEEGRRLVSLKRFAEACPKFAASKRLEAGIGVGLWLGDCLESNGQTASAYREFVETANLAQERADPRESVARGRANTLLPHLSRIVLSPMAPVGDNVEVDCDGSPFPRTRWSTGLFVDPGPHHLRAKDGGTPFWEADVAVGARADVETVRLALDQPLVPSPPSTPAAAAPPRVPRSSARTRYRIAAASSAGVGLVAVGLGAYFGIEAIHDSNASNAPGGCGSMYCSQSGHDLRVDATQNATASDVSFGIAAAAIAGGVLLYLLGNRTLESAAPSPRGVGYLVRF
jgi:hypothetical protein